MGTFDLPCALSGLSTSWPGSSGSLKEVPIDSSQTRAYVELKNASDVRCSMFLLEQRGDTFVPFTLPVSGFYDYYGGISLDNLAPPETWDLTKPIFCVTCKRCYPDQRICPRHDTGLVPIPPGREPSPHAVWVGDQLLALLSRGVLTTTATPKTVVDFFKLDDLRHEGTPLVPCLYRDDVAGAVASPATDPRERELLASVDPETAPIYADWLEAHARPLHAAYARSEYAFGIPPDDSRLTRTRFHDLLRWIEPHGGFRPPAGGEQHSNSDIRDSAQHAWKLDDPALQVIIQTRRSEWAAKWTTAADVARQHVAVTSAKPAKSYRPAAAFAVGDVIDHPIFGHGSVEELVRPNKISVRFATETKILVHKPA
ncbi:MAG: hypothetical protein ABI467_11955 [Kofleriaceae bacterium]